MCAEDFNRSDFNPNNWGGDVGDFIQRPFDNPVSTYVTLGFVPAIAQATGTFDVNDPFGTKAAMNAQQTMMNRYFAQQEQLLREEQNRRWQSEISGSWAAYGAQRRSMVGSGGNSGSQLGTASATDIYLGGR